MRKPATYAAVAWRKKNEKRLAALKPKKPQPNNPAISQSPCAGKCRHQWCDGYNAGYSDGQVDGESDSKAGSAG